MDPERPQAPVPERGLRADIQGLRAVAVLMVLLYHAGIPFVRGGFAGVDVFFVISGFLITGLMVREAERTGRLSLRTFWARRARRLLPATALVLVAVTVGSVLFLPQLRWAGTAGDIGAAALYVINWRLAASSLDYLAQDYAPSPVQHFWSLAVEEQFYLIWPVLIVVLLACCRRFHWPLRRVLFTGVGLLTAASLIWSIHLGSTPSAFFVTTTRGWELGIGAAAALLAPRLRTMNAVLARGLTWAGVLVLAAVALWLPDTLPWPGSAAAIPVLATAAVIAAGPAAGAAGATFLLGRRPMRFVGDLSYALYLWHWPLVVFATVHWGELSAKRGLVVVALSFVPAYLSYRLVESPIHRSATLGRFPNRALGLGAACTATGVLAAIGLWVLIPDVPALAASARPGAAALISDPAHAIAQHQASAISPDPLVARGDVPDLYHRKCQSDYPDDTVTKCVFGTGPVRASVMLIGDSRAAQWSPALQVVAAQQHWQVTTITKAGCPLGATLLVKGAKGHELPYHSCTRWNAKIMTMLTAGPDRPDFVFVSAYAPYMASVGGQVLSPDVSQQAVTDGVHRTWAALNAAKIPVVAMRETPLMTQDIVECVSAHRNELEKCATSQRKALRRAHVMQNAAKGLPWTDVIDLTRSAVCPVSPCPVVIGNVLVYRDNHHLTAEYARSLAPFLSQALAELKGKDFAGGALDDILPGAK